MSQTASRRPLLGLLIGTLLLGLLWGLWPDPVSAPQPATAPDEVAQRNGKRTASVDDPVDAAPKPELPPAFAQAYDALSDEMSQGYVTCVFAAEADDDRIKLRYPVWHGSAVTGFPYQPEGAEVLNNRVPSPEEDDTGYVREPVAMYRWWDAAKGQQGVCVVEPIEEIEIRGVLLDDEGLMPGEKLIVCNQSLVTDDAGGFSVQTIAGKRCMAMHRKGRLALDDEKPRNSATIPTHAGERRATVELHWSPKPPPDPDRVINNAEFLLDQIDEEDEGFASERALQQEGLSETARGVLQEMLEQDRQAAKREQKLADDLEDIIADKLQQLEEE